ncbi:MAG: sensor histidine kinase [Kineosporiaceae bacterium]
MDAGTVLLSRWLMAAGMVYRCVGAPASLIAFLGAAPSVSRPVMWVLGALGVAVAFNGVAAVAVFRRPFRPLPGASWLFLADLTVAVALNLALAAALPPGTQNDEAHDVAWFYLVGTVATWTALRGLPAGATVLLVGIPLQFAMTAVNGTPVADQPLDKLLVREGWAVIGFALSTITLAMYRRGRGLARLEGQRAGRAAERTRQYRDLHDTALQTLEAIALMSGDHRSDARRRLAAIGSAARGQAAEIRALLERDGADPPPPPAAGVPCALRQQAGVAIAAGLEVRLVVEDLEVDPRPQVDPAAVDALRQAVGEALTNVGKHAGVRRVTVRATTTSGAVQVRVADLGRGFDADGTAGYGLRQSIQGRMSEVGGGADIWSVPGRGTVVTLTVPRVDTADRPPLVAPRVGDRVPSRARPVADGDEAGVTVPG